ncbi:MAG: RDD family protein [Myxococcota bacterium]
MEAPNPYAAPQAESEYTPQDDHPELIDASTGQRFLTFIIDYIGTMIFGFIAGFGLAIIGGAEALMSVPDFVLGVIFMVTYYVLFETTLGRTPGKYLAGTRVVTDDGSAPTFLKVLGRSFARLVPFEAFSAFSSSGRMWHDSWSGTRVVTTRLPQWAKNNP